MKEGNQFLNREVVGWCVTTLTIRCSRISEQRLLIQFIVDFEMIAVRTTQEVKSYSTSSTSGRGSSSRKVGLLCELSWGHDDDSARVRSPQKKSHVFRKKPNRASRRRCRLRLLPYRKMEQNETKPK